MCFSAPASFVAGVTLSAIGVASLRSARHPEMRLVAALPLVFGAQQLAEGFVWLALASAGHETMLRVSVAVFLTTALVVWPVMSPLAMMRAEHDLRRWRALSALLGVGIAVSALFGAGLVATDVSARVSDHHISYVVALPPVLSNLGSVLYVVATVVPLFVSSVPRMRVFGGLVVFSYLVTLLFFREQLTSVWCFYAAVASLAIWWIVRRSPLVDHGARAGSPR